MNKKAPHFSPFQIIRKNIEFTYIVLGIFLTSCTAQFPVSTIYAKDEQTQSLVRWPVITDEASKHSIKVIPLENVGEMLLFEVEVTNNSKDSIPIAPNQWQMEYFSSLQSYKSHQPDLMSYPLSGNKVNNEYQKIAKKIQAAKDGSSFFIALGIVVLFVAIIALESKSDSNNSDHSYTHNNNYSSVFNLSLCSHTNSFRQPRTQGWTEKEKVSFFKQRGKELALVNNDLQMIPPGETYLYGLFFPRIEAAINLKLYGQVGADSYQWEFQHDGLNTAKTKL